MHVYLYDTFLSQKKFDSVLAKIETRTTDLGLNGKIVRMNITNSVKETVENEIKKGAKTITAVGNNALINKTINALAKASAKNVLAQKIPLGIIPIGKKNNDIAEYLGIPPEQEACDILSARRIQEIDLGKANDNFFATYAKIPSQGSTVEIDKNYSIEIKGGGQIFVVNMPTDLNMPENCQANALDGVMELFIKTEHGYKFLNSGKGSGSSVFSFDSLNIYNRAFPLVIDNSVEISTPVALKIAKEKIKIIVGKTRRF